jgi:hypothetical protein
MAQFGQELYQSMLEEMEKPFQTEQPVPAKIQTSYKYECGTAVNSQSLKILWSYLSRVL